MLLFEPQSRLYQLMYWVPLFQKNPTCLWSFQGIGVQVQWEIVQHDYYSPTYEQKFNLFQMSTGEIHLIHIWVTKSTYLNNTKRNSQLYVHGRIIPHTTVAHCTTILVLSILRTPSHIPLLLEFQHSLPPLLYQCTSIEYIVHPQVPTWSNSRMFFSLPVLLHDHVCEHNAELGRLPRLFSIEVYMYCIWSNIFFELQNHRWYLSLYNI